MEAKMERVTVWNEKIKEYSLINKLSDNDLINTLGKTEDYLEELQKKSASLIQNVINLLEVTKIEDQEFRNKLEQNL